MNCFLIYRRVLDRQTKRWRTSTISAASHREQLADNFGAKIFSHLRRSRLSPCDSHSGQWPHLRSQGIGSADCTFINIKAPVIYLASFFVKYWDSIAVFKVQTATSADASGVMENVEFLYQWVANPIIATDGHVVVENSNFKSNQCLSYARSLRSLCRTWLAGMRWLGHGISRRVVRRPSWTYSQLRSEQLNVRRE